MWKLVVLIPHNSWHDDGCKMTLAKTEIWWLVRLLLCSAVCAYISKIDSASFASVSAASSLRLKQTTPSKRHWSILNIFCKKKWDDHVYYSYCHSNHTHTHTPIHHIQDSLVQALNNYPDTCAVLVRRHGVYVWGDTWQSTKTKWVIPLSPLFLTSYSGWPPQQSVPLCRCECYDYLFDIAVRMKQCGLDPAQPQWDTVV